MPKPSGEPFQDMCTMVGVMTITWAWAENALALAIGIIDERIDDLRGHPELPVSLKKRLSYLRNALKNVTELEPIKQDGALLVKLFVELSPRRHELVHGSTWIMPHGGFETLRFTIKGRKHTAQQKRVEIGEVVLFNREVEKLAHAAVMFQSRVAEMFDEV